MPDGLYKLLSREEAVVAAQVFDYLCGLTDFANLQMEEVCSMYDNQIAACPNLKAFLREENAPLLAYLRFAPRPLRLREFLLRRQMNNELNFPPNFEGLVLGCIDADFCK